MKWKKNAHIFKLSAKEREVPILYALLGLARLLWIGAFTALVLPGSPWVFEPGFW